MPFLMTNIQVIPHGTFLCTWSCFTSVKIHIFWKSVHFFFYYCNSLTVYLQRRKGGLVSVLDYPWHDTIAPFICNSLPYSCGYNYVAFCPEPKLSIKSEFQVCFILIRNVSRLPTTGYKCSSLLKFVPQFDGLVMCRKIKGPKLKWSI